MDMQPARALRFKGAIFDLDGLLLDSEPIWRKAQRLAFDELGAELTEGMQVETTGLGLEAAMLIWKQWFPGIYLEEGWIRSRLVELALEGIRDAGHAKAGAHATIKICSEAGCKMAIASSSSMLFIQAALERLGVAPFFQAIVSGEDEKNGKPHPAVYLAAAKRLGVMPGDCIAFEDSVHGLHSAKAAGMHCLAVPDKFHRKDPRFAIADLVMDSLEDFRSEWLFNA